jgi:hypothetical protein
MEKLLGTASRSKKFVVPPLGSTDRPYRTSMQKMGHAQSDWMTGKLLGNRLDTL